MSDNEEISKLESVASIEAHQLLINSNGKTLNADGLTQKEYSTLIRKQLGYIESDFGAPIGRIGRHELNSRHKPGTRKFEDVKAMITKQ
jgi:hypothetical protein